MDFSRVSRLSDGQRECLRRVLSHKSSKEIAIELGISPHTVDQRLRAAIKILNVSNRFEAARLLAVSEPIIPYQQPVYQALDIEKELYSDQSEPVEQEDETLNVSEIDERSDKLREISSNISPSQVNLLDGIWNGREKSESSIFHRIVMIVVLSILIALAFGMFVTGVEALSRLAYGE
jgi:DNA-binding CsgD family transcriptional regulator